MEMATDTAGQDYSEDETPERVAECAQVKKLLATVKGDKEHWNKEVFPAMRRDMQLARIGSTKEWAKAGNYVANIVGRHVKQKTAALYAKNPRITAKRRERLDFAIWDENPASLMLAFQTVQAAAMAAQQAQATPPAMDMETGAVVQAEPQLPPGFMEAQALLADFQQGMQYRQNVTKIGKTLEILFAQAMREQEPLDFKMSMKSAVRRACTTCVGYVELGFQREMGPRPGLSEALADARARLDHMQRLSQEAAEGEIEADDPEIYELEQSIAALQSEPEVLLQEGLIFDFPQSTKVIPDRLCKSIVGFIGCRHLTLEYVYTQDQVKELFPDVDLKKGYAGYRSDGSKDDEGKPENYVVDDNANGEKKGDSLVCVYKVYDKPSGLVSFVIDGYKYFARPPAPPDVFVEKFWPVYALTFNAVEDEDNPFPPSDATLLQPMQAEYNRSRQGQREHRKAARPRWALPESVLSDEKDWEQFKKCEPFEVVRLKIDPQVKLADVLQVIPVPGVDPNLYETNMIFTDVQLVGGTQESSYGGVAKATATESAIAANSSQSTDGSAIDDLDAFLTMVARGAGQILLREMSEEKVMEVCGPGALWPHMTLAEIAGEVFLEVEAGSTGKPNQMVEVQNFKELAPLLIQIPGIGPEWLAKKAIQVLDDKTDLTEAIVAGMPSIVMQNSMKQPGTGDAETEPTAQGDKGGDNGPQPPGQTGSEPAFGSNQV
jgi:hypothetical protein